VEPFRVQLPPPLSWPERLWKILHVLFALPFIFLFGAFTLPPAYLLGLVPTWLIYRRGDPSATFACEVCPPWLVPLMLLPITLFLLFWHRLRSFSLACAAWVFLRLCPRSGPGIIQRLTSPR